MADENIVVRITADDSELVASLNNISNQAEGLDSVIGDVSSNISDSLDGSVVDGFTDSTAQATKGVKGLDAETKKGTRSFGRFTRGAGRGVSALGRFGGASFRTAGRLGSLGAMLAGTPFGPFAIAAGAASIAINMFGKAAKDEEKNIKDLNKNIKDLNQDIKESELELRKQQIDLSGLSDREKALKNIEILKEKELELENKIKETKDIQNVFDNINNNEQIKKVGQLFNIKKTEEEILKINKQSKESKASELSDEVKLKNVQLQIKSEREKIKKILENESAEAAKALKIEQDKLLLIEKAAAEAQKLTDSLIRNELQKQLTDLDRAAEKREKRFKIATKIEFGEKKIATEKINAFVLESQKVLEEDKTALRKQFADAEKLASEAIFSERAQERLESELEFLESKQRLKTAEIELELENQRQIFAQKKQSEEAITEFEKEQNLEREQNELNFQIKKLEIIKNFDKQISKERKNAIDAEIKLLKERLAGLGVVVVQQAEETSKDVKKKGKGFGGLLGLNEEESKKANDALKQTINESVSLIQKGVADRIAALEKEVDFRNERISEIQADLANEIELNKLGKASNIRNLQERLELEKTERDKAESERKKAAQAQFAIDTALQASALVTSIANLYLSLSKLPLGIGVGLATALSGVLLASFIGAKAQAAAAVGFADGGYTGDGAYTGDGGKYEPAGIVHKGEFVVDKETTQRLGLRNKSMADFDGVMGEHYSDIPTAQTIGRKNKKISSRINNQIRQQKEQVLLSYERGIQNALNGQNSILKGILKATESTPIVFPLGDDKYLIERGKFKKEIKKIKK
tara:strand:+ start:5822 stop:8266 length:2445 start_codon:yes stop_codon:yes gene_type:complete